MKKKIVNILKYSLFTSLGVLLFWLVYRGQDFGNIWHTLRFEVDYRWVALSVFLGILSHISRSMRWLIALEPLGEKPRKSNTFIAVIMGYFMNLLLPRMGEVARCVVLNRYEKISLPKLLGTVITERIVDVVVLFLFTAVVVLFDFGRIVEFVGQNPLVIGKVKAVISSPVLWAVLLWLVVGIVFYLRRNARKKGKNRIGELIQGFVEGMKSVRAMKRYKAYIAHSFFIWLMYYLMLYAFFFSFEFTRGLGPLAGLTTFVFSSFAMVAPVQGGIGAWHFMAESALSLYRISAANGKIFALLAHSVTQLVILVVGAVSFIALPIINRGHSPKNDIGTNLNDISNTQTD